MFLFELERQTKVELNDVQEVSNKEKVQLLFEAIPYEPSQSSIAE